MSHISDDIEFHKQINKLPFSQMSLKPTFRSYLPYNLIFLMKTLDTTPHGQLCYLQNCHSYSTGKVCTE